MKTKTIKLIEDCDLGKAGSIITTDKAGGEEYIRTGRAVDPDKEELKFDKKSVKQYYQMLSHENETEIRIFPKGIPKTIFVNNEHNFVFYCQKYNAKCNIYAGINERVKNGTKDKDVKALKLFYIDIDPKRKKDTSAIDQQKENALKLAKEIATYLQNKGHNRITIGDSGNGYHIYLRLNPININEKNREEIKEKWKAFGDKIKETFHGKHNCNVDSVFNLSRISKVLGTLSVKGKTHRLSKFLKYDISVNEGLREDILATEIKHINVRGGIAQPVSNERFKTLLEKDKKLSDLYEGKWKNLGYESRSEAEQAFVSKLIWYEFPESQIRTIMENSGIGKWQEKSEAYKSMTIRKACEFIQKVKSESKKSTIGTEEKKKEILTIDSGRTVYQILDPSCAIIDIPTYYISADFVTHLTFMPTVVIEQIYNKKEKKYFEEKEEKNAPFILLMDSKGQRQIYPLSNLIWYNGKRYKIDAKEQYLTKIQTMMSPKATIRFLNGERVNGKQCWENIKEIFDKHYDPTDPREIILDTAQTIATHYFWAFDKFPFGHNYGPIGAGKSHDQRITSLLAYHGTFENAEPTKAYLSRIIHSLGATIILDNAEYIWDEGKSDPKVQQIILTGNTKSGFVDIVDKETHKPLMFRSYSPKFFNSENEIPPALRSRTIQKACKKTITNKDKLDLDENEIAEIRDDLYLLRLLEGCKIAKQAQDSRELEEKLKKNFGLEMINRDRDVWLPLLIITTNFGSEEDFKDLISYIKEYIESNKTEYIDTPDATVLRVARKVLKSKPLDPERYVPIRDIRLEIIKEDPEAHKIKRESTLRIIDNPKIGQCNICGQTKLLLTHTWTSENVGICSKCAQQQKEEDIEIKISSPTAKFYSEWRIGYLLKKLGFRKKREVNGRIERYLSLTKVENQIKATGLSFGEE